MVSKKILGVAIAAAMLSQGAFAAPLNLSGDSAATSLKIAKQAITTAAETSVGSGWYNVVDTGVGSTIDFDLTSKLGIGLAVNQKIYIKVKLTNAKFGATLTTGSFAVTSNGTALAAGAGNATEDTIAQGGVAGNDTVILTVSPAAGEAFGIADTVTLTLSALQINGSAVSAEVTTFDSVASAVAGTNVLYTANNVSGSTITYPSDAVTAAVASPSTVTASVDELFKKFVTQAGVVSGSNLVAQFGQLSTALATYSELDGSPIELADVVTDTTSTVKFKGDFSAGNWYVSDDATGTTKTALTLNTAKDEATTTLNVIATKPYLLVVENGTAQIPVSTITADVTFTAPANGAFGAVAADTGNASGSIVRDGTTVLVPFINVNPAFNQKIIIVNRSTASAAVTLTNLIPDAQTTGFALTSAGSAISALTASKQTVLNTPDLFTVDAASTSK